MKTTIISLYRQTFVHIVYSVVSLLFFSSSIYAEPYRFRNLKLGMTLEDFRNTPHPDHEKDKNHRPICTKDAATSDLSNRLDLEVTGTLTKAGVRICKYYYNPAKWSKQLFAEGVHVGHIEAPVTFEFLQDKLSPKLLRLFRIEIWASSENFTHLLTAYKEKFGKPARISNKPLRNKIGATFENYVVTWQNQESSIILQQRKDKIDTMQILYTHTELFEELTKRLEQIEGKPSDKL